MEVTTCKKCGKLFNYVRGPVICPLCQKEMEDKFHIVKKFLYDHPRTGIRELSEACEVPIPQINRWIREERLCFSDDSPICINCENCGAQIRTGRFCKSCKNKMQGEFASAAGLGVKKDANKGKHFRDTKENKMRFLN